uniref:Uncharacterized protein n=1 Tax=Timema cristinae TaxID=61476 RepID=A0A7R9DRV7_TIMCR|nr:unnamed protein product [Timema cristinae]
MPVKQEKDNSRSPSMKGKSPTMFRWWVEGGAW